VVGAVMIELSDDVVLLGGTAQAGQWLWQGQHQDLQLWRLFSMLASSVGELIVLILL